MNAVIDAAIKAGKFPASRRKFYEDLMASDPKSTERLIASLQAVPGVERFAASAASGERVLRGPIKSSAGIPLRPHPMGGYYMNVERP
jgi:hypothetical protein